MADFTQHISTSDYRKAITLHYFRYRFTYLLPVLGVFGLGVIGISIITSPEGPPPPWLLILLCVYGIVRPWFYIQNVLKSAQTNKFARADHRVQISVDTISFTAGGSHSVLELANLYAFYDTRDFLLLYTARNQFFVLDKRPMGNEAENLVEKLRTYGIKQR